MRKIFFWSLILGALSACTGSSTEENMLYLLQQEKIAGKSPKNLFSSDGRLHYADSMLQKIGSNPLSILLMKSEALLELGRTREAADILEGLSKRSDIAGSDSLSTLIMNRLALSYLRMGEQDNCLTNHTSESCIFPIRGRGVHVKPEGSAHAIQLYEALLKRNPADLESRWLLNIAYMTLGKYPHDVPAEYLIQGFESDTSVRVKPFEDIAAGLSLNVRNMAGGAVVEDFDNDGYLDIVLSGLSLEEPMSYFRNNANGTFTDLSKESGLKKFTGGLNIMQTDYNNDGYKDIFVARGGWQLEFGTQPNSLLKNNGDGTFTDVTIESGLLSFHPTQTAAWDDFNNDGWLDIFIGNETYGSNQAIHPCELYINNGDGTFTEVAEKSNCNYIAYVKAVTSGDYDHDGWKDIFISTTQGENTLLRNKGGQGGNIVFENVTRKALPDVRCKTFPAWFWDYDNDGWLDLLVCDYTFKSSLAYYAAAHALNVPQKNIGQVILYRNNRNGTFSDVTNEMGLFTSVFAMGSNFGDIDNDGYQDMYFGTGNPDYRSLVPNKMFRNVEGKRFEDVTTAARVGNLQKGHGVAFADMDNDGDQDIYIEMGGSYPGDAYPNSFYLNPGQSSNNWICISLEGTTSNRSAIGSSLKITFQEDGKTRSVYRDVNSGGSFGASPLRREIGIGKAARIDEIEIRWHGSGKVQKFTNISPNQFIRIREGENMIETVSLKRIEFKKSGKQAHCHM